MKIHDLGIRTKLLAWLPAPRPRPSLTPWPQGPEKFHEA